MLEGDVERLEVSGEGRHLGVDDSFEGGELDKERTRGGDGEPAGRGLEQLGCGGQGVGVR